MLQQQEDEQAPLQQDEQELLVVVPLLERLLASLRFVLMSSSNDLVLIRAKDRMGMTMGGDMMIENSLSMLSLEYTTIEEETRCHRLLHPRIL